jgi:hypothetical protein
MKKVEIFRIPIIQTKVYNKQAYIRNIFSKYESRQNLLLTGFMQTFSHQIRMVHSGVIRVGKLYYIVNVQLVCKLKQYNLTIYSPNSCRRYLATFRTEQIKSWCNDFIKS